MLFSVGVWVLLLFTCVQCHQTSVPCHFYLQHSLLFTLFLPPFEGNRKKWDLKLWALCADTSGLECAPVKLAPACFSFHMWRTKEMWRFRRWWWVLQTHSVCFSSTWGAVRDMPALLTGCSWKNNPCALSPQLFNCCCNKQALLSSSPCRLCILEIAWGQTCSLQAASASGRLWW